MVSKIIKEVLLVLLTCLLAMLLFAILLYEYIPNRKVVPEVVQYKASEKVSEQVADDIDKKKDDVVLTYEVTASDLNNYKVTKDYVPGKANPFDSAKKNVETGATEDKNNLSNGNTSVNTQDNTSSGTSGRNSSNKSTVDNGSNEKNTNSQDDESTLK